MSAHSLRRAPARVLVVCALLGVALALAPGRVVAPALAAGNAVINDCNNHAELTHTYSRAELQHALAIMPAYVKEYTNCYTVISNALAAAAGGGGGGGGGGSFLPTPVIVILVLLVLAAVTFGALAVRRRSGGGGPDGGGPGGPHGPGGPGAAGGPAGEPGAGS